MSITKLYATSRSARVSQVLDDHLVLVKYELPQAAKLQLSADNDTTYQMMVSVMNDWDSSELPSVYVSDKARAPRRPATTTTATPTPGTSTQTAPPESSPHSPASPPTSAPPGSTTPQVNPALPDPSLPKKHSSAGEQSTTASGMKKKRKNEQPPKDVRGFVTPEVWARFPKFFGECFLRNGWIRCRYCPAYGYMKTRSIESQIQRHLDTQVHAENKRKGILVDDANLPPPTEGSFDEGYPPTPSEQQCAILGLGMPPSAEDFLGAELADDAGFRGGYGNLGEYQQPVLPRTAGANVPAPGVPNTDTDTITRVSAPGLAATHRRHPTAAHPTHQRRGQTAHGPDSRPCPGGRPPAHRHHSTADPVPSCCRCARWRANHTWSASTQRTGAGAGTPPDHECAITGTLARIQTPPTPWRKRAPEKTPGPVNLVFSSSAASGGRSGLEKKFHESDLDGASRPPTFQNVPASGVGTRLCLGGHVFKISDSHAGHFVTVKEVECSTTEEKNRVIQGAFKLGRIQHPSILSCQDVFLRDTPDGNQLVCLVRDFCELGNMDALVKTLDTADRDAAAHDLIDALAELFRHDTIPHDPLKPEHILFRADGPTRRPRLMLCLGGDTHRPERTSLFMAPEITLADGGSDRRHADWFSAGLVLTCLYARLTSDELRSQTQPHVPGTMPESRLHDLIRGLLRGNDPEVVQAILGLTGEIIWARSGSEIIFGTPATPGPTFTGIIASAKEISATHATASSLTSQEDATP
ncbi:hypothetical protein PAPYR_4638 [Paratrimastix pyriformis]|uniref:Protein kinase domain-containing protein n=1 Tax=Paratrimastix pyriformis TaxID=342808 RepID=A0ABQ8UJF3_9EUKA|nr:hypothetical protein PAPYR_4638 [Paratrimastix pyriformis]